MAVRTSRAQVRDLGLGLGLQLLGLGLGLGLELPVLWVWVVEDMRTNDQYGNKDLQGTG